ncbi:unnamed protein product [Diabrotica balteata]|uniref:Lipase domain-containing protein n=1 Tax=Diabrotica balteata TaxID=107213 RepID=A0A9N9XA26_DIABA|nr:unnamed protein product [Diabrotica balteata]
MKNCKIYVILFLLGACHSLPDDDLEDDSEDLEYFLYEDKDGQIQVEYLVHTSLNLTCSPSDVKYLFFSRSNPDRGIEIHSNNIHKLERTSFTPNRETVFIIHGWKGSHEADHNYHIREYTLNRHDVNVFVVDWSPIAGKLYVIAKNLVKKVGGFVADFVRSLVNEYGLQLGRLKFVGHSLGAHVCGNAGAALNGQVDTIVGLDPAGPLFKRFRTDNRIDREDAVNVQIIHTNGGRLGYYNLCGDSDFYPNGGRHQPGCGIDIVGTCSHSRSYKLYAESLFGDAFIGQRCRSYLEYKRGKCTGPKASMGMFHIDKNASGPYYLKTNSQPPYAQG